MDELFALRYIMPMIVPSCQHCNVLNSQKLDLFIGARSTATGAKQGGGGCGGATPPEFWKGGFNPP